MTVRVGESRSLPKRVNAGAPQGSVLGCYLFNVAIDEFEEGSPRSQQQITQQKTLSHATDYPAASTPARVAPASKNPVDMSPIDRADLPDFEFLPRARNVPPWSRKPKDPNWVDHPLLSLKFVDDGANAEKINLRKEPLLTEGGESIKLVSPTRTLSLLETITENAKDKGMIVNESKTTLMCFSAAKTFIPKVKLNLDGVEIKSSDTVKLLGITLTNNCSFLKHTIAVKNKLRAKSWMLSKLKKAGMTETQLIRTYKNLVRPAAEYAVPAWHSMLTSTQSDMIERQQSQALRNIYGMGINTSKMRNKANLPLLSTRRREACLKFARKCLTNSRCSHWFTERTVPRYARRNNVNYNKYNEPISRTDRHRNSPKVYLTRLLNNNG